MHRQAARARLAAVTELYAEIASIVNAAPSRARPVRLAALTVLWPVLTLSAGGPSAAQQYPEWPQVTREARPWTRWWWHGSAVREAEITDELRAFDRAGLGGVEITPIYGVSGSEPHFIEYLTPRWLDVLEHTLREAERLDLGVDMATGNGWPFGGPWVTAADASKYVTHRRYRLRGGERLREPVAVRQEPVLRAVGNQIYESHGILAVPGQPAQGTMERPLQRPGSRAIDITELRDPVASNPNLQSLALDQVRFPRPLPLQTLMAYSAAGEVVDLTGRVGADGRLDWTAPPGDWTLYALFQGWHGKQVERAGPGGEGDVIDHFSAQALQRYLARFDDAFRERDIGSLRAFFNDSYEVDDASGEADWTPRFLEEFRSRRGYDLRRFLPALFGEDTAERNERVLTDYRQTISDLILEHFTDQWREWSHGKGALVRNQAHGSPANILDLYAASDIPETEGTEILRMKFASSAAHVAGRRLVAAEASTWLGEHFRSTLADVRANVDLYLLGGVNHVVYHGSAYSPRSEPWPGWLFYAAVHFNPQNPWWGDFAALNRYLGRAQAFLQAGEPDSDLLLYFPISDWFARRSGDALLTHFRGMPADSGGTTAFVGGATGLQARGYAFDFLSDRQLRGVREADGALRTAGGSYRALVVPHSRYIPLETMDRIVELARQGATVIAYRGLPDDVAGLAELDARRARFRALVDGLRPVAVAEGGIREARVGSGAILVGDDLDALLARARVRRESMADQGLQFVRRRNADGATYFIANRGATPVDGWATLETGGRSAALYDPMLERSGYAAVRSAGTGRIQVYLQIPAGESRIVRTYDVERSGAPWEYLRPAGEPRPLRGSWTVRFVDGGPVLPGPVRTEHLGSWTELGGDDVQRFSGTATYSLHFPRPALPPGAEGWILDLGEVQQSARVRLNGRELGTLLGPGFRVPVHPTLLEEQNTLEVSVTNLMANRIADMDRRGVFWKKFYNVNFPARLRENRGENGLFDASGWSPLPSGLLGPVTLTPTERFQP